MVKKSEQSARKAATATAVAATSATTTKATTTTSAKKTATITSSSNESFVQVCNKLWTNYNTKAPKRTKLIDSFMAFLVLIGVFQFAFVLVFGTFVS